MTRNVRSAWLGALLWVCLAPPPAEAAAHEVRILRDEYGVPHVYADDLGALFFGFGHAIAEDRLFQLEMTRRTSWGTVAELLGPDYLEVDRNMRRLGYTRQDVQQQLARLLPEYRTMLRGYADGINAVIDEIARGEAKLPADFKTLGFTPAPWSEEDIGQLFISFMATRYSDGSGSVELRDAAWMAEWTARFGPEKAKLLFDDLITSRDDPSSIPTIPRGEDWRARAVPASGSAPRPTNESAPWRRSGAVPPGVAQVAQRLIAQEAARNEAIHALGVPTRIGSYGWVIGPGRTRNGTTILLGGPQMGIFSPAYLYEVGLHGAGFDLVGSTPIGHVPVLFGHNATAAWSATAGNGDPVDVFVEKLDPKDPTRYLFKGEWRRLDTREEVFKVKGGAPVKETFYRSVHGPIESLDVKNGVAYARSRAFAGLELESMAGWIDGSRAETFDAFVAASRRNALSISWIYAERKGNIGFAYCGRYPVRHPDQDRRLPTPGEGEREWRGFVPAEEVPHVMNPARGFLVNWNNQPAEGWISPGLFLGKVHASRPIIEFFERKGVITLEDVKASVRLAAYLDHTVQFFRPRLLDAVRLLAPADAELQAAAELVRKWDAQTVDLDLDGKFDSAGQTIYSTWLRQMLQDTFTDQNVGSLSRTLQQQGNSALLRVLDGPRAALPLKGDYLGDSTPEQAMVAALRKTVETLRKAHGPAPEQWLTAYRAHGIESMNYLGVPQSAGAHAKPFVKQAEGNWVSRVPEGYEKTMRFPPMKRGSENHFVVLGEKGVIGLNVVAPGTSGIAPRPGAPSPHFADQVELLVLFEYKPMRFHAADVRSAAESETRLSYAPAPPARR
jgi:penicillin amidase